MPKLSTPLTPLAVIEWRVAPKHVDSETRDEDRNWTRHSRCTPDQAEARVAELTAEQSESGYFEFRVRPAAARLQSALP